MKTLNKILLLAIVLSSAFYQLFAQQIQENQSRFSGVIRDPNHRNNTNKMRIDYNIYDGVDAGSTKHLFVKIDSSGKFQFELPDLNKPYKIHIIVSNNLRPLFAFNSYTESGDNVKMQIVLINNMKSDSAIFSGFGSEKYTLARILNRQFWKEYYSDLKALNTESFKDSEELSLKMDKLASLLKKYKIQKLNTIKSFNISHQMKVIMNYEYATYSSEWAWRAKLLYRNIKYRTQVAHNYLLYNNILFDTPNDLSIYCKLYLDGLSTKTALDLIMINVSNKTGLTTTYNYIKANYKKDIRDRLIYNCLFNRIMSRNFDYYTSSTMDSILKDAEKIVLIPIVKQKINNEIARLKKVNTVKVIQSEFVGLSGEKIRLESLKGKVFLIDTWFNGCFGCAGFHKVFKEKIYPKFKDDKNFIVLSINIDTDRDRWIKGIESEFYTSKEYLNVTTANWLDHPFFKYYNIIGSPWIMLVDANGDVCYQPNGTSVEELTTQITSALIKVKKNPSK